MKPILYILFAIVLAMVLCCDVDAAGPYNCGPNGCGPAYGRAAVGQYRGPVRRFGSRLRARRPIRNLVAAILGR